MREKHTRAELAAHLRRMAAIHESTAAEFAGRVKFAGLMVEMVQGRKGGTN